MKKTSSLMVQGTSSSAGKSLLVTALCRYFSRKGINVAPFKAQNMSLNAAVTEDGKEIPRAQATQAQAAGVAPTTNMAPILLKPTHHGLSQLIVHGEVEGHYKALEYQLVKEKLKKVVIGALEDLKQSHDAIIIEGAGSPVEMNLKQHDICNMFVAQKTGAPVLLVHNIDPGGMFASFKGTIVLLTREERKHIAGLIINNIRGDQTLLDDAPKMLYGYTKKNVLGMLPHMDKRILPPPEDSASHIFFQNRLPPWKSDLDIVVLALPYLANFDDFSLLDEEEDVSLRLSSKSADIRSCDLLIIPGSKNTFHDLLWIKKHSLDRIIKERHLKNAPTIGICAGYQMLGKTLHDPHHLEAKKETTLTGMNLLPITTVYNKVKTTTPIRLIAYGRCPFFPLKNQTIHGYEIHMGQITMEPEASPLFLKNTKEEEGCYNNHTIGTLCHGLFENRQLRLFFLNALRKRRNISIKKETLVLSKNDRFNALADMLEKHMDMKSIQRIFLKGAP